MRTLLALPLLLAGLLSAQVSPVVDALSSGDARRALELLEGGAVPEDDGLRLQAIRLLAEVPAGDAKLHERALRWAAQLLPSKVPAGLAEQHQSLALVVGKKLTSLLVAHKDVAVDGRITDRNHLGAGVAAQQALVLGGAGAGPEMLALAEHLAPLLLLGERARDAVSVATAGLGASPTGRQIALLHGCVARGLLQLGRAADALPHAQHLVHSDPTDAEVVLTITRAMPPSMATDVFPMLRGVIGSQPRSGAEAAWTQCLLDFYTAAGRLGAKKATAALVSGLTQRIPMPQIWHQQLWGEGFRIWMDADARKSKVASGKDGLILPVPQSQGWRRRQRAPDDLRRWENMAYCVERGDRGPTFIVYWFGPNLEYWYGDTPAARGVTAKTVRGHSAASIADMIFDYAYGTDARRRNQKFTAHPAPPFALGESGLHRRTFALGDTVYDETVFSHGQVAVEVLLRATKAQLVELEPELRWMYATFRAD